MTEQTGELIQGYAHAKWTAKPDERHIARLGARLDPKLRERVDALGFDAEHLLEVAPGDVLRKLQALERQAAEEDARASRAAAHVRAQEQKAIDRRASGTWHPAEAKSRVRTKNVERRRKRPRPPQR